MSNVEVGKALPNFEFEATSELKGHLADFAGQNVVLYIYPRDKTPGCTDESIQFTELHEQFKALNTVILGMSRDTLKSHESFKAKYNMPFELISDPEEKLCKDLFNVMVDKNMYGKKVRGIERSTFLIDADGILRQEWRKAKVPGHAEIVLEAVKAL